MSTYYINATRKDSGDSVDEIEGYRIDTQKSRNGGTYFEKEEFFDEEYDEDDDYYTYNPDSGMTSACEAKISSSGEWYLQSESDGTLSDNLLNLPDV